MLILFAVVKVLNFFELNKKYIFSSNLFYFLSYSSWVIAQIYGAKCVNFPDAIYIHFRLLSYVCSIHSPIFACCHIARLVYNYRRLKPVID
jgi:hypothetical protein